MWAPQDDSEDTSSGNSGESKEGKDASRASEKDTDISYCTAQVRSGNIRRENKTDKSFFRMTPYFDITHKIKEARPKHFVPVLKFPDGYVKVVVDDARLRKSLKITKRKLEKWNKKKRPKGSQLKIDDTDSDLDSKSDLSTTVVRANGSKCTDTNNNNINAVGEAVASTGTASSSTSSATTSKRMNKNKNEKENDNDSDLDSGTGTGIKTET
jgi:hypothetical protein